MCRVLYYLWAGLAAWACSPAPPHAVFVGEGGNNHTVHVRQGTNLEVVLHSSYWTIKGSSRSAVLKQDGSQKLLRAPAGGCLPGIGCRPVGMTFTAERPGTAVVTASRTTCGEALLCALSQRGYKLTVIVTK